MAQGRTQGHGGCNSQSSGASAASSPASLFELRSDAGEIRRFIGLAPAWAQAGASIDAVSRPRCSRETNGGSRHRSRLPEAGAVASMPDERLLAVKWRWSHLRAAVMVSTKAPLTMDSERVANASHPRGSDRRFDLHRVRFTRLQRVGRTQRFQLLPPLPVSSSTFNRPVWTIPCIGCVERSTAADSFWRA